MPLRGMLWHPIWDAMASIFPHVLKGEQRGLMVIYSVTVGCAGYEGIDR